MGYLKSMGTGFVWICTFLAAITFIPGLPPNVDFMPYSFKPPVALNKEPNEQLNGAEKLFEGEIKGPEAFDAYDGVLYTTLHGGGVSKFVDNKLVEVVKFGTDCDGLWEEEKCGRPLGLKFDVNGNLYVVDAYYGIFKVDVKTGKYEKVVDTSVPIEDKISMIPNSIDVAKNGDLYWTVSSTQYKLYDGLFSMLSDPTGRLIRYNAATKKNEVLIENLGFANGIKLSDDESFVIVAETMTSRIIKYYLKGPKAGKSEIFIESLPGLPDNIHSDGKGNFLVSLVLQADEQHPQLSQSLAPHPYIRKMILRFVNLIELPFKFLEDIYPNYYSKRIIHWIGHFESISFISLPTVVVLRIDSTGKILNVFQATDKKISGISSAFPLGNYLWLGSPFNPYLARVTLDKVLPELKTTLKREPKVTNESAEKRIKQQSESKHNQVPTTPAPKSTTTPTTPRPTTTTAKPKSVPSTPPPKVTLPSSTEPKLKEQAKATVESVKNPNVVQKEPIKMQQIPKTTQQTNAKPVKENLSERKTAQPVPRDEM